MKDSDIIVSGHGGGGRLSNELISKLVLPFIGNDILCKLDDGAVFDIGGVRLAFSTDTYTVTPVFFPGGNIGDLAVNGTVNDVAMCGAVPLYLSLGLVIEEGFALGELKKIIETININAQKAGVSIVTGDTKVVPKGAADKIFINTSGIGIVPDKVNVSSDNARYGDKIILSGTIGDHGVTILTQRQGLEFSSPLESDTASLNHIVKNMLEVCKEGIHVLRDPTRGGVGTALNEIAEKSYVGITIYEKSIPVKKQTSGVCSLLGLDPLYIANEGKLIAFVAPDDCDKILSIIKKDPLGKDAVVIGEVTEKNQGKVFMKTSIGGVRIVDMLTGEPIPRIC